jgi:Fe2+ or Zn2+ uptake regulation protein
MKKHRNTMQRQVIFDSLRKFDTHPTVEEVYAEIKKTHPAISKNTVYRNLRHLSETGEIRKVLLPGEQERYDRLTIQHYHFQCENCGGISDIEIDYLKGVDEAVEQKYGIRISEHEIVFRGICPNCGEIRK